MSRDIYVQDIPESAASVDEIPEDWIPQPLRYTSVDVVEAARAYASGVDDSDESLVHISDSGIDIELSLDGGKPTLHELRTPRSLN